MYFDAKKEFPHDMPKPKRKLIKMTVFVNANHAHDFDDQKISNGNHGNIK